MWTTEKTRRTDISPRPLRVAYLIPESPCHTLLDTIFDEAMSRWGGRRTPIIATDGLTIRQAEWNLLDLWDADIIYSYVNLQDELHDRISYCLAPSVLETHRDVGADHDHRAFRPAASQLDWALKSISVLPRIARLKEIRRERVVEVLDKERGSRTERDLADSFGFLSNCLVDLSLSPYAKRLSFQEVGHDKFAPRFSGDEVISYISDVNEMEGRISNERDLLFPSQMSDMFCPYLNALHDYRNSWEDHLTIVVGGEVEDRLLFWNAIHRYKSLDVFRSNQILRFDPSRFQNGLPAWIEHLCSGVINNRHLDHNHAPNVRIISSTISVERLEEISNNIRSLRHVMSSFSKLAVSDIFEPLREKDPRERYQYGLTLWPAWNWQDIRVIESVRIENGEIDLPCVKPWHINDFPLGPTTIGAWLQDLKIERSEDHSRYSNTIHHWMFPRRLALHNGITVENYGGSRAAVHPPLRPTERGSLSVWDDPRWKRPTLRLPHDIDAFYQALVKHHPNTISEREAHRGKTSHTRIQTVKLSDKGRDLLGVLRFFRNLNEAVVFLTNPYILSVISKLSPTDPAENQDRISMLKKELADRLIGRSSDDQDLDRAAKRVLELAARWLKKESKENEYVSYASLLQQLTEIAKDKIDRRDMDDCIKFLRNQNFLLQGYGWRCARCQHSNWTSLKDISNSLECVICSSPEDAPIGGDVNSHFKLNPFVSAAFSPTSAQGSVIWCLSLLLQRAQHSFMLTPTLDIKDEAEVPRGTDLDVLACVDGKVHFYEVKRSFAGINSKQIDEFIHLSSLFRPDYAGFAIQNAANRDTLTKNDISTIRDALRKIDVEFVLQVGSNDQRSFAFGDVPPNVGETMRWNIW